MQPMAITSRRAATIARGEAKDARRIAALQQPAADAAIRIQAGAYTAHTALLCSELLTMQESAAFRRTPTGEERYTSIVNAFCGLATAEIVRLGL